MRLVLVGTSYQRAPVELRELLAYDPELRRRGAGAAGGRTAPRRPCSRPATARRSTGSAPSRRELEERIYGELAELSGLSHTELAPGALHGGRRGGRRPPLPRRRRARLDGARRGADPRPGAGGVRGGRETETAGPTLHRLFRQALRVGKRVRTETAIGENPASVSSAAAQLAERVFEDLAGRRILLLGAGKTADLTAREPDLPRRRRDRRGQPLAGARRGAGAALRRPRRRARRRSRPSSSQADVVVASTSSQGFVLSAAQVERAMKERRGRPDVLHRHRRARATSTRP